MDLQEVAAPARGNHLAVLSLIDRAYHMTVPIDCHAHMLALEYEQFALPMRARYRGRRNIGNGCRRRLAPRDRTCVDEHPLG